MIRTVKKPEERKMDIVKAARTLFQSNGYNQTSMQDVIDTLGIAKGTVYYYFASKEDLLEAVVDDIIDESVERMQKMIDESSGNALEILRLLVSAGNMTDDNDRVLLEMHCRSNYEMHGRLLATAILKQAPFYARLFEQGCKEGIFQTDTPLETAEFILTAVQYLTDLGIYPWTEETLSRRSKAVPAMMERLLMAPPGSFQFLYPNISQNGDNK